MRALIVGFGRAGKELHLECLTKFVSALTETNVLNEIGVIDPNQKRDAKLPMVKFMASMADARDFSPNDTVVHVCTPPDLRLSIMREAVHFGFKNFIIEKPLALSIPEADSILQIERESDLKVVVVSPWLSSPLMKELQNIVLEEKLGKLLSVVVRHDKPRFIRSLTNTSHSTAFDVELPHGLGIAFSLAGKPHQIIASHCYDLAIDSSIVPHMGGAGVAYVHANTVLSLVSSNLMATERTRTVSVAFENGTAILHLPTSGDDSHSCLRTFNSGGDLLDFKRCLEEPLVRALGDYYSYFRGERKKPQSDTELHSSIVMAVVQAKVSCGLVCNGLTHATSPLRRAVNSVHTLPATNIKTKDGNPNGFSPMNGKLPYFQGVI